MSRWVRVITAVLVVVSLSTCSLRASRPLVQVQVAVPQLTNRGSVRFGRGPTFPKCVAFSFASASTSDGLSSSQISAMKPSCLLLNGIVSVAVSAEVAANPGVSVTLPAGQYTVTAVGIQSAAECANIPTMFSQALPEIYRLGPSKDLSTSQAKVAIAIDYQSSAPDLVNTCLPPRWVKSVAAGGGNSCASELGAAKCWGDNVYGQLGDSSVTSSLEPVQVLGLVSDVSGLAATQHACAAVNGAAKCWGLNGTGELGDNSLISSTVPLQVQGLTSGVTAITVASIPGGGHTCALVNGGIQCWGDNTEGKLGNNSTAISLVPVQVQGITSGATAVSANTEHTCAVVQASAKCWGSNSAGQLGINSLADSTVPLQVQGLTSGVTAIAAGAQFTCAIQNGAVLCWGINTTGQLGINSNVISLIPVPVQGLSSGATAIATGSNHACAVVSGGVQCWGKNDFGNLGNDSNVSSLVPVPAQGLNSGVTSIAAGSVHTCATHNGGVKCWGGNSAGQLGNGANGDVWVPATVIGIGP